jgi:class 3 adenylate cyclase
MIDDGGPQGRSVHVPRCHNRAVSEPVIRPGDPPSDPVAPGREAYARHDWPAAFAALSRADEQHGLSGPDLEMLADAAFFAARADARLAILERAFKAYLADGNHVRAAFVALDLANNLGLRRKMSLASAWTRRAERLLDGQPESNAHSYLALVRSEMAVAEGSVDDGLDLAMEAAAIAMRTGDADLHALALSRQATIKVATGATAEGFALLEEAAISAVNGELSPMVAGVTSCQMISVCRDLTDYRRAGEWLEATDQWCERQEVSGFPGICRVHRAEIVALRGGWERAERELRQATSELAAYEAIPPMADGLYAIGEICRLKGDVEGAEDALRQAHALGRTPQPALALLRLSAGKVKAASAAIDAALAEPNWDQWARARLLAAQVEIAVAAGDPQRARAAADELSAIVADYQSPALEAGRRQALGRVLLAEGDAAAAVGELRSAIGSWRDVGAPYEVARARALLSRALRAVGNEDDADLELGAARDEFGRLGAQPDLATADAELQSIAERRARPGQVRMAFMFTDIVGSTGLAEALGDEAWERLLAWHDATLRGLFDRHAGRVVNSTGDGFFVAFNEPRQALDCAIAVQRALDDHRQASGFAPPVRIGIHAADATQRGGDYSGIGVHVASRIAGLADGGEILASLDTLPGGAGDPSEVRDVAVKGVTGPVRIATVSWR